MKNIKTFLKGIVVGIGGIAPGLSGSVLMVILGLYSDVVEAIATIFKSFKKNILYLLPLGIGMVFGVVLFSRLINYTIENYEIQTRLCFLGLLIGTVPLFYKEIKKEKQLSKSHYFMILISFCLGLFLLTFNKNIQITKELNILQSFVLGFVGISAMIIPGIDGASILSAFGLYNNWLDLTSLNNISLNVYVPAGLGMIAGGLLLSKLVNFLLKKDYTATFSVLFGFFLSIIPSVLKSENGGFIHLANDSGTYIGIALFFVGVICSYFFSKLSKD